MALTVSHGKKLDAERASCHKVENEQKSECPFTDIESVSWAKDAISNLFEKGIISGYGF